ncbi:MAG: DUF502 domain-containing protein [Planctomycetes bacterium]|nr:DUF502 domain-containing protein [Planctomycetota bacterium]
MSVATSVKRYFLRGLAVLLPTILTLWILAWGYSFLQEHVSIHVNRGLVRALVWFHQSRGMSQEALAQYQTALEGIFVRGFAGSAVGLLLAVVAIFLFGAFLASVIGRVLWRVLESTIMSAPVLRRIYPHVKQVTDFVLTPEQKKKSFLHVVAVEYPRKGLWTLGFVTGTGLREIAEQAGKELLTVLVPKSPALVSGYVITVAKEDAIFLDMTVEEGFRFLVSAGVILPENERQVPRPRAEAGPVRQPQLT